MYVQLVTYRLAGISEREYLDVANDLAARFSALPGLLSKLWLANSEEARYGAVYLWDDRAAMERFLRSDLFEATNPEFSDTTTGDFEVLENLTAATQPVIELVTPRRQPPSPHPSPTAPRRKAAGAGSGAKKIPVATKSGGATKAAKAATKAPAKAGGTKAAKRAPAKTTNKAGKTAR